MATSRRRNWIGFIVLLVIVGVSLIALWPSDDASLPAETDGTTSEERVADTPGVMSTVGGADSLGSGPRPYSLAGTVITLDGNAVPNLRIELWHASGDGLSTVVDATDAKGGFDARVSMKGAYFAEFEGSRLLGSGNAGELDVVFLYEAPAREDRSILIDVVAPKPKIKPRRGSPFEVSVVSAGGGAVREAQVVLQWVHGEERGYSKKTTDEEGMARFETVPPAARFSVRVNTGQTDPPVPGWWGRDQPFGDGTLSVQLSDVVPLSGTLFGTPEQLAEMTVHMQGADERNSGSVETARPDPTTGAFAFRTAQAGSYRISVPKPAHARGLAPGRVTSATAPATDVRVHAPTSLVVQGQLLAPSPNRWWVSWYQKPYVATAVVGSDGHFRIPGVRDERGSLIARLRGSDRIAFLGDVDPKSGPFDLRPVRAQTITGRVDGLVGKAHASIAIRRGTFVAYFPVVGGAFEARGMPPGFWTVELRLGFGVRDRVEGVDHSTQDLVLRASK